MLPWFPYSVGAACIDPNHPCPAIFGLDPWEGKDQEAECDGDANDSLEQLRVDASHCGACGHDCLGGSCNDGICEAKVGSGGTPVALAGDASFLYLATNERILRLDPADWSVTPLVEGINPSALALSANDVYWAQWTGDVGDVRRVPKVGGDPLILGELSGVVELVLVDDQLVARTASEIWALPMQGGTATQLTAEHPVAIAANQTHAFFVDGGALYRVSPGVGLVEQLFTVGDCVDIAVDEITVYCLRESSLESAALDGAGTLFVVDNHGGDILMLHDDYVYWLNEGSPATGLIGGSVVRARKAGGELLPLYCPGYEPDWFSAPFSLPPSITVAGSWVFAGIAGSVVAAPK